MEINAKTVAYENEKASLLLKHQAALAAANTEVMSFDRLIESERGVNADIHYKRESYEATIQRLGDELNKVEQDADRAARSSEISLAEAQRKVFHPQFLSH